MATHKALEVWTESITRVTRIDKLIAKKLEFLASTDILDELGNI